MRNTYILPIISFLYLSQTFAQSFTLSDANGPLPNGSVVEVIAVPGTDLVQFYASITNISINTKNVRVRKTEIQLVTGSLNTFCFAGHCYGTGVFTSPDQLTLAPGQTSARNDFYGDYLPENNQGTSRIRYTFFNSQNTSDTVSVVVHYIIGFVRINELLATLTNAISSPFPNPASTSVSFDISLPPQVSDAKLVVRNLLGGQVMEKQLSQALERVSLPVHDLREGIYFYTLLVNGDNAVKTGKLIVKR
ncbi:MAG: T9SS type A sorting domain-containing protein [Bacteroidales bacterium]|nr:T9SS type A sorting domain-containing protein [Bacteroidales bacterium]